MDQKIGGILLKENVISQDQLDRTLKAQAIFGGKFGSNLLELGFIDEQTLSYYLSEQLKIPFAHPKLFDNIDKDVIALIPHEVAERFHAIPISFHKTFLRVAMSNPANVTAVDELSFIIGKRIEPVVAPEIQIMKALERYYNIHMNRRYLSINNNDVRKATSSVSSETSVKASPASEISRDNQRFEQGDTYILEREVRELNPQGPSPSAHEAQVFNLMQEIKNFTHYDAQLNQAQTMDEILDTTLNFLNKVLRRVAFFVFKKDLFHGWKAKLGGSKTIYINEIKIPADEAFVFKPIIKNHHIYTSTMIKDPHLSKLYSICGGDEPKNVLLIPVASGGKLIGLFCGDNGGGTKISQKEISEVSHIPAKLSTAVGNLSTFH